MADAPDPFRVKIEKLKPSQFQTMAVHDRHRRILSYSRSSRIARRCSLQSATTTAVIELDDLSEIVSIEVHYRKLRPRLAFDTVEGIRQIEGSVQMPDLGQAACEVFVCEGRYPFVGFNDAAPDLFVSGHGLLFAIRNQRLIGIGFTDITEHRI